MTNRRWHFALLPVEFGMSWWNEYPVYCWISSQWINPEIVTVEEAQLPILAFAQTHLFFRKREVSLPMAEHYVKLSKLSESPSNLSQFFHPSKCLLHKLKHVRTFSLLLKIYGSFSLNHPWALRFCVHEPTKNRLSVLLCEVGRVELRSVSSLCFFVLFLSVSNNIIFWPPQERGAHGTSPVAKHKREDEKENCGSLTSRCTKVPLSFSWKRSVIPERPSFSVYVHLQCLEREALKKGISLSPDVQWNCDWL